MREILFELCVFGNAGVGIEVDEAEVIASGEVLAVARPADCVDVRALLARLEDSLDGEAKNASPRGVDHVFGRLKLQKTEAARLL